MSEAKATLSTKSIIFWRHIAGIAIVLLWQSHYESVPHFLGRWLGTIVIAFGTAGIICGFGYLFFTSYLKGKIVRIFIISAWVMAGALLFGQWVLPDLVQRIAGSESMAERDQAKELGVTPQEYKRRVARGNVICHRDPLPNSTFIEFDVACWDAVMAGRR